MYLGLLWKSLLPNLTILRDDYGPQSVTARKGMRADLLYPLGKLDPFKGCAARKGFIPDFLQPIRKPDRFKGCAARKGAIFDILDSIPQIDLL